MKALQRGGIGQFTALWWGSVVLSFGLLGGGLPYAVPRLNAKTQHLASRNRISRVNYGLSFCFSGGFAQ